MQLTSHTDYALRVLIYLATVQDKQATISEIADFFNISRNHLVKIVHQLGMYGFVKTTRGKKGGLSLLCDAQHIYVGDVVRKMENHFMWAECFDPNEHRCRLNNGCQLKVLLQRAGDAYLQVLDNTSLAQLLYKPLN